MRANGKNTCQLSIYILLLISLKSHSINFCLYIIIQTVVPQPLPLKKKKAWEIKFATPLSPKEICILISTEGDNVIR